MSGEQGNDSNFNELVGNLLSSRNDPQHLNQSIDNADHDRGSDIANHTGDHQSGIESPNFGTEEEDLAAVVASAIENMNEQSSQANGPMLEEHEQHTEGVVKEKRNSYKIAGVKVRENEENEIDREQNQEWATMLQQGLTQGHERPHMQAEEQLDQDDETLRRAILESLQELNFRDKEKENDITEEPILKGKDKKSKMRRPSKKSSSSHSSSYSSKRKKDGKKKKNRKVNDNDDDLLNFEDVIRGFMHPETGNGQDEPSSIEDGEIQALVEATLKAFERELLGPTGNTPKTTKKKSSHKRSAHKRKARTYTPLDLENYRDASKNGKKEQQEDSVGESEDGDDFSKQLAEMVNQVVNTTASVEPAAGVQGPEQDFVPSSQGANEDLSSQDIQASPRGLVDGMSETFDLNEIMQRAMNMAFQEQEEQKENEQQELEAHVDRSTIEGSSHDLEGLNITDLDRELTPDGKYTFSKDASKIEKASKDRSRHTKSTRSLEEKVKKKYSQVALSAAHAAKKRLSEKNRINKLKEKEERQKVREDKKSRKKAQQEKLEEERKELEKIVARGPPYPPDLRLTKSGKPKKPYRRWTTEELAKRAALLSKEANNSLKEGKVGKKKSRQLKRIPLCNLKNIPIFQFIKSNVANGTRTKPGLNGIEDALTRIPLASTNLNLSGLIQANGIPVGQTTGGKGEDETEGDLMPLILQCKTVVRREKIPFHPPWAIPERPPFALPVARRRKKEKTNESATYDGIKNSVNQTKSSDSMDVRNKILPAVLLPIFSALKAAAKANAASGATSEESLQLLMNVIKYTKNTMIQILQSSAKTPSNETFMMKAQQDNVRKKVRRRPIFSLANIRKVDTTNDEPRITSSQNSKDNNIKTAETKEMENSISPVLQETSSTRESSTLALKKVLGNEKRDNELMSPPDDKASAGVKQLSPNFNGSLANDPACGQDRNESAPTNEDFKAYPGLIGESGNAVNNDALQIHGELYGRSPQVRPERSIVETAPEGNGEKAAKKRLAKGTVDSSKDKSGENSERLPEEIQGKNEEASQIRGGPEDTQQGSNAFAGISKSRGEAVAIGDEANHNSPNAQSQTKKQAEVPCYEFEDLVKQQLIQSYGTHIDLPHNLSSIISTTLASLFLDLNGHKENGEKGEFRPEVRRYKKSPPPVLNLDGLVPPSGIQIVSKDVAQPVRESAASSPIPKLKRPRKKSEQPVLLHTFNVPNLKDIQGRRTMLLKRAKGYLNDEEMGILKREINKERKRKWREVNVEKNWEHDLRSRLKKRANVKFGESSSTEKNQWYENEVAKNLSERGIKHDDYLNNGGGKVGGRKNTGSTNLSDNEVLNMIATSLGKLDVARRLERELNELRKPNETKLSNLNKQDTNIIDQTSGMRDVRKRAPHITEIRTIEGTRSEKEIDQTSQNGKLKRTYPDDIPLIMPMLKKSKFLNAEGNS